MLLPFWLLSAGTFSSNTQRASEGATFLVIRQLLRWQEGHSHHSSTSQDNGSPPQWVGEGNRIK